MQSVLADEIRQKQTQLYRLEVQLKIGLTHEFSDMYVRMENSIDEKKANGITFDEKEEEGFIDRYQKKVIKRMHEEGDYLKLNARRIVRDARESSKGFVKIHKSINERGLGRQTDWLGLVLEMIRECKEAIRSTSTEAPEITA